MKRLKKIKMRSNMAGPDHGGFWADDVVSVGTRGMTDELAERLVKQGYATVIEEVQEVVQVVTQPAK